MRFGVVILGAGASARMGRPKLLLPWPGRDSRSSSLQAGKGKTILAHLIDRWRGLGSSQIAVVIEAKSPLAAELDRFPAVERIVNLKPELGMFSSVQCAARWEGWKKEVTHFVITLGDQPHVGIETLKAIINFARENPEWICQPARNGRGRHPVVLPRRIFLEVAKSTETNLKEFLAVRERKMFASDDAGLDVDLDTPEDYQRALRLVK